MECLFSVHEGQFTVGKDHSFYRLQYYMAFSMTAHSKINLMGTTAPDFFNRDYSVQQDYRNRSTQNPAFQKNKTEV